MVHTPPESIISMFSKKAKDCTCEIEQEMFREH